MTSFVSNAALAQARAKLRAAAVIREGEAIPGAWVFIRLSYVEVGQMRRGDLSSFLNLVQTKARRQGARVVWFWVAEHQKRGALHYHIVARFGRCRDGSQFAIRKPDKGQTYVARGRPCQARSIAWNPLAQAGAWWPHGSTRIEFIQGAKGLDCAHAYVLKYIGKDFGRAVNGRHISARYFGSSRLGEAERQELRFRRAPVNVRALAEVPEYLRVVGGGYQVARVGGWLDVASGKTAAAGIWQGRKGVFLTDWQDEDGYGMVPARLRQAALRGHLWSVLEFASRQGAEQVGTTPDYAFVERTLDASPDWRWQWVEGEKYLMRYPASVEERKAAVAQRAAGLALHAARMRAISGHLAAGELDSMNGANMVQWSLWRLEQISPSLSLVGRYL